tara:strand:- start:947 stop:1255 length:309 start_codon:yes stop_codon:yes gene_type:complete
MASKGVLNITSATTTTLINKFRQQGNINQITICNKHASTDAVVTLAIDDLEGDQQSEVAIVSGLTIPAGVTLLLDHDIAFDNDTQALILTNTGGTPLSVIIK